MRWIMRGRGRSSRFRVFEHEDDKFRARNSCGVVNKVRYLIIKV